MDEPMLHVIEGMPGVGKTTFARSLCKRLRMSGNRCELYLEETSQPLDLFRQAVLTQTQYDAILRRFPDCAGELERQSFFTGEYRIAAYTMLSGAALAKELRAYDIGDGRTPFGRYKELHLALWRYFANTARENGADCRYVSEGALFHNQLFDIVGFYSFTTDELLDYFCELIETVGGLGLRLYYLSVSDIPGLIEKTLRERGDAAGTWGAGFESWLKYSPYGKRNRLSGAAGMEQAYACIDSLARMVLKHANAPVEYIDRTELRCRDAAE